MASKALIKAAKEIREALHPMPDGYVVDINESSEGIIVTNRPYDLCFFISPLQIRDGDYIKIAKQSYADLILASPARGNA